MTYNLEVAVDPQTFAPILALTNNGTFKQKICDIETSENKIIPNGTEAVESIMKKLSPADFTLDEIIFIKQSLIDKSILPTNAVLS
jgi:hypothetical protein